MAGPRTLTLIGLCVGVLVIAAGAWEAGRGPRHAISVRPSRLFKGVLEQIGHHIASTGGCVRLRRNGAPGRVLPNRGASIEELSGQADWCVQVMVGFTPDGQAASVSPR